MGDDLAPDWILQQALGVQSAAHRAFVKDKGLGPADPGLVLTVLGCGAIGTAILEGLFQAAAAQAHSGSSPRALSLFRACVQTKESKSRIEKELGQYESFSSLQIYTDDSIRAIEEADVVLLSCGADAVPGLFQSEQLKRALSGKTLVSVVSGWTPGQIRRTVYGHEQQLPGQCVMIRAAPGLAAARRQSVTAVAQSQPPLPADQAQIVNDMFAQLGSVEWVPESRIDAYAALCSSGSALTATMLESLAGGAIAVGLPREDSYRIAARVMQSTADAVLLGERPATLREKANTPGECTSHGLAVLEEAAIRGTLTRAVQAILGAAKRQ